MPRHLKSFTICALVLAMGCLLLASCVQSKHPLSDPAKSTPNERLWGLWETTEGDGDSVYWHVGPCGEGFPAGVMRAIKVVHSKKHVPTSDETELFFVTELAGSTYLNQIVFPDGLRIDKWMPNHIEGFNILKFQLDGDTVTMLDANDDVLKEAIRTNKIQGEILKGDTPRLTDNSDNLVKFFTAAGNTLFKTKVGAEVLHRLR